MIGDRPIDELVLMWLKTEFDGGRHAQRLHKIGQIESVHRSKAQHDDRPPGNSEAGSTKRPKPKHE
jgi:ribose 5-phosphate isomerase B